MILKIIFDVRILDLFNIDFFFFKMLLFCKRYLCIIFVFNILVIDDIRVMINGVIFLLRLIGSFSIFLEIICMGFFNNEVFSGVIFIFFCSNLFFS